MDIKQEKKHAHTFYCYKIVVEVLIISCIISIYRPYLTEAMYKIWRKSVLENYFKKIVAKFSPANNWRIVVELYKLAW